MKFNYQARNKKGDIQAGQIEASSKEAAALLLRKNDLYVTFLDEVSAPFYARSIKIFGGVNRREIVLFSRQLAIMFKSKVPLVESLKVLGVQTVNADFKEKILRIAEEVESGTTFSKALGLFPQVFSAYYIAMTRSGEVSGKLSEVLSYLADHLEKEYHLNSKIKGAMIYPALVLVVVFLVVGLMIYYVIPQLASVLESSATELPQVTKIVISASAALRKYGVFIMAGIVGLFILIWTLISKTPTGKRTYDKVVLRLPVIGDFLRMLYVARFAENLSTLIIGGLPIAQALETVGDIMTNIHYKEAILKIRDKVRAGEPISSVLFQYLQLFPPLFIQMVVVGERTGSIDTVLMNIVDFYQKEIDRTIDSMLNILEPAMILFLGVIVGGIMLSILMPLYQTIGNM